MRRNLLLNNMTTTAVTDSEWQERFTKTEHSLTEKAQQLVNFDSMVLIEIPQREITDPVNYRTWMYNLEIQWMEEFNKNQFYRTNGAWNDEEGGIGGQFGEHYFSSCKFYRYDGTRRLFHSDDWRTKRGLLVRDHYSARNTAKVYIIADNMCEFLSQEHVQHTRRNFDREKRIIS